MPETTQPKVKQPKIASDADRSFAAARSHEDVKAANALFQTAGQSFILINGGAATAILTFSVSNASTARVSFGVLAVSVLVYAAGVLFGALIIIYQAVSVKHFAMRWQKIALDDKLERIDEAKLLGEHYGAVSTKCLVFSAVCFVVGSVVLAISVSGVLKLYAT